MSLLDTLLGIFNDEDTHNEFNQNPSGFLNQNGHGNVTSQDIEAEMPRVLEAMQGNSGGASQGGVANFAGSGNVTLPPPPDHTGAGGGFAEGGLSGAIESINHYQTVLNDHEPVVPGQRRHQHRRRRHDGRRLGEPEHHRLR